MLWSIRVLIMCFPPWGIFEVAAGYVTTSEMVTDYVENHLGMDYRIQFV